MNNVLLGDGMDYKVIINPELGGSEVGINYGGEKAKDFNLRFSKLLSNKLKDIGVSNLLLRNNDVNMTSEERINLIKEIGSTPLVISNGVSNDGNLEIIYPLRSNDVLASRLANSLEENGFIVNKYYQRRSNSVPVKDYEAIFRDNVNPSIIIRYGNLNGRINEIIDVIANTIKSYLGLANDYYIVKKGDNLYSIARKYNTTVDVIKKLNNLTNNNLSIGQRLTIKAIPTTDDSNTYYIVKKGDNLYSIARKYNTTVDEIKRLNNLTNNNLSIGQKLIIKTISMTTDYYIVKKGDTLYDIARKYNTTIDNIKRLNNLTNNNLSIGQRLVIKAI